MEHLRVFFMRRVICLMCLLSSNSPLGQMNNVWNQAGFQETDHVPHGPAVLFADLGFELNLFKLFTSKRSWAFRPELLLPRLTWYFCVLCQAGSNMVQPGQQPQHSASCVFSKGRGCQTYVVLCKHKNQCVCTPCSQG